VAPTACTAGSNPRVLAWCRRQWAVVRSAALRRAGELARDRSGTTLVILVLCSTLLIGFAGLGLDVSLWYLAHNRLQVAADSAALNAASALSRHRAGEDAQGSSDYAGRARTTAAALGFVDGHDGVAVAVNRPPQSGGHRADPNSVEVVISEPLVLLFSAMFFTGQPVQSVRAVARASGSIAIVE
jgi:Flp pilus assembly protein TadG